MPWRYFEKANAYGFIWPRWVFAVFIICFLVMAMLSKKTDRKSDDFP